MGSGFMLCRCVPMADGRVSNEAVVLVVVSLALVAGLGWSGLIAAKERKAEVAVPIVNKTTKPTRPEQTAPDAGISAAGEAAMQAAFQAHLQEFWPGRAQPGHIAAHFRCRDCRP